MSTLLRGRQLAEAKEDELGGQMSFLDHLDELRKRLIRSIVFVFLATAGCWFVSDRIYSFLALPVERALAEAQRREVPIVGLTGNETIVGLNSLKENDVGRYIFPEETELGTSVIPFGASVMARVSKDAQGQLGLFTEEALYAGNIVIPKGVKLPVNFAALPQAFSGINDKLIVTSALDPFSLYVKVSLYAALCLSVPFLLYQIWAFVAPGLYPHERSYVTPFVALSSVSFVIGAMFAYYVIFPPAAKYLLGLGGDFRLLLKANDYFDFII
ncbi:MAG: twin-arginine translocase subunit TatC, partial [Pyrinomonadaceae bacterium]